MYLITGAGGGSRQRQSSVVKLLVDDDQPVRAMVRRDDDRAERLRDLGAEVVVGDLTRAGDIVGAMDGVSRMFFNMSVSSDYLLATAEVCAVARERGHLDVLVNMSQMTVSQMTLTSTDESKHQRLHWLSEHVLNWSGLPVIHVRPTVFLDNPLFTALASQTHPGPRRTRLAVRRRTHLADRGRRRRRRRRRHPARSHGPHRCRIRVDRPGSARRRRAGRPIQPRTRAADIRRGLPARRWQRDVLAVIGLPDHVQQHIATMARLHREDRYNRATDDVERIIGRPAQTVAQYVASHRDLFD